MAANDAITTGNELNQYTGNAALAGGSENTGYAKFDLSPLHEYALKRYDINEADYKQQQLDRKALEDQYMDPEINVPLDEHLAVQLQPKLNRLKDLMAMNLEKNTNSKQFYEFKNLYKELLKDTARAKAVQTLKDQYKDMAGTGQQIEAPTGQARAAAGRTTTRTKTGATTTTTTAPTYAAQEGQDEHEKENLNNYVKQLEGLKIDQDIPVYNKYFGYNQAHLPESSFVKGRRQVIEGNNLVTKEFSIVDPSDLDKKAIDQRMRNPEVYTTGEDIAHTLLDHRTGDRNTQLENINQAARDTYSKGIIYKWGTLKEQYADEYKAYSKANPKASFQEFMNVKHPDDENKIKNSMAYLNGGQTGEARDAIEMIPVPQGEPKLQNYTYSADGKNRLSVDNDKLRAIYGATAKAAGASETDVLSEVSKLPAEIEKLKAETGRQKALTDTAKALTALRYSQKHLADVKAKGLDQTLNPSETFNELFKGKIHAEKTTFGGGNTVARVNQQDMPKAFLDNLDIAPINQKGDYNVAPVNVRYKGVGVSEQQAQDMYKQWLRDPKTGKLSAAAKEMGTKINKDTPDIFDFLYSMGSNFDIDIVGKVAPVYKYGRDPKTGDPIQTIVNQGDLNKIARSNRLQSWMKQRSDDLKVKGAALIMQDQGGENAGNAAIE